MEHQREMLALSFISYAGEAVTGSDEEVEQKLVTCFQGELGNQPLTKGRWNLVWGPAVFKFNHAKFSDNLMYVVQGIDRPERLVVAVRGTNSKAILDWIREDLEVFHLKDWPYGDPPSSLKPRISRATHNGLTALQGMTPEAGSGAGLTLQKFLAQQVAQGGVTRVDVTGHSLGGALSPTLTLWLADTREEWDPQGKVDLNVTSFAGPTAGNEDFAVYSDSRIGKATIRVHNQYDLAPLIWNAGHLETTPDLYEPELKMPEAVKLALDGIILKVDKLAYTQVRPDSPPLPGKLSGQSNFGKEVGWQHDCGYVCNLGINDQFNPVTTDCGNDTRPKCVCP